MLFAPVQNPPLDIVHRKINDDTAANKKRYVNVCSSMEMSFFINGLSSVFDKNNELFMIYKYYVL